MPLHDWGQVSTSSFHHFHRDWTIEICRSLNNGLLPDGYSALVEHHTGRPEPDVVALSETDETDLEFSPNQSSNILSVLDVPVNTKLIATAADVRYAQRSNRIKIETAVGKVVSIIEIVSPGNKRSHNEINRFIEKCIDFINLGIQVLIVDVFPPTRRDPFGLHSLIWEQLQGDERVSGITEPERGSVAYAVGQTITAYYQPLTLGAPLPDMPIFLTEEYYLPCPLEVTYQQSWSVFPKGMKPALEAEGN